MKTETYYLEIDDKIFSGFYLKIMFFSFTDNIFAVIDMYRIFIFLCMQFKISITYSTKTYLISD